MRGHETQRRAPALTGPGHDLTITQDEATRLGRWVRRLGMDAETLRLIRVRGDIRDK
jgi:hypothetical protein